MGYQQWILKFKFLLSNSKNGFNILFFIRIWRITKCLLPSVYSIPFCLLVLLFAASCFYEFLAYHCGMISGRFSKALVDGLYDSYIKELTIAIILVLCQSFCTSVVCYLGNILYVAWRSVLTNRLHRDYFSSDRYYKINILHQRSIIDNPDQRITQDVDKLCLALSEVFVKLILTPITIAYYSYKSHKSVGSKPLLYIYLFFIGFAILNKFLMSPVSRWVAEQEKKEGNFRFQHVSVRTNAESIAFQQAGQAEMIKSNRKLHELIRTLQTIFNFQLFLKASMEFSAYFAALLSYISIAGPIFSGKYANFSAGAISGIIENNAFVVIYLIGKLTIFVNIAIDVTKLTGTAHRVGQLMEEMDNLGYDDEGSIQTRSSSETGVPMKVKDPPDFLLFDSIFDRFLIDFGREEHVIERHDAQLKFVWNLKRFVYVITTP
ncbi:ATP-binding cassette sub-family D member 4 [Nymphon striatum]|nr:ATP-binding cassette sub-family D member 4 [Nymphon striatum]